MKRKRHGWSTVASMMNGEYHSGCFSCGILRSISYDGQRLYLWRDGKWRRKCPPCKPEVCDER